MEIRKLNQEVSVSPQVNPADVVKIADAGFRSIICNRPDGEEQDQPTATEIGVAAEAAGLDLSYVPAVVGALTSADAELMARSMAELPRPIVVVNALAALAGRDPVSDYDGYGSCPLTVEAGKIVLAEFGYGGKLLPTFPTWRHLKVCSPDNDFTDISGTSSMPRASIAPLDR